MHRVSKLSFPTRPAILLLVPVVIALLAACTPDNNQSTFGTAGPVAKSQADLFNFIFWIAAVVFVLVEGAIIYIAIRYRRRSDSDKLPYQTHGNNKLEITWTIIPVFILIAIAIPTLTGIWEQQNGAPDDMGEVLNVACGKSYDLLELAKRMGEILGVTCECEFAPTRVGEVLHSCASIQAATKVLGYEPVMTFDEGLRDTLSFFSQTYGQLARE